MTAVMVESCYVIRHQEGGAWRLECTADTCSAGGASATTVSHVVVIESILCVSVYGGLLVPSPLNRASRRRPCPGRDEEILALLSKLGFTEKASLQSLAGN